MEKNYLALVLRSFFSICLLCSPGLFAQTQMTIWDFATVTNASTTSFNATTHTLAATPTIQQLNQTIDNNGIAGKAYTDVNGVSHSAGSAIAWDDITGSGTDAELIISLNTTGYNAISMRFDYKSESANSFDLEYSTNGGSSWTQIINNTAITSDGFTAWYSKTLNLSSYTALNNQPNLKIKIQDLDNTGNDNFAFDNIELYASGSSTTTTGSANPSIELHASTTDYLYLNATSGMASGVINDVTDPCRTKGINFLLRDGNTALNTLTLSALSSNTGVVTNANLTFTYFNDSIRNLKITPTGVGYSTITVKVSDGTTNDTYVLNYAASAAAYSVPNTDFHTGISDASTAIDVGNNYFLSGDDESNALHLYHKDSSGYFFNTTDIAGPMGISGEGDFEASCRKGNTIYWMGSLGNSKSGNIQTSRHRFFATTVAGTGSLTTATYIGSQALRASMISWGDSKGYNFTASAANGMIPKQIGGLNVEGLCLGPNDTSLYIGFRAPLVPLSNRTKALICPVKDFETWFNNGNPVGTPQYGNPIELNLGGRGIRSLEKNANGQYLIVAGSYDSNLNAALYEWNGSPTSAPVLLTADLTTLNPEGIVSFPSPFYNGSTVELMSDDGTQEWYNDGIENKVLPNIEHKKFRTVKVPTTGGTLMPCTGASLTAVAASQTVVCTGNSSVININGSLNGAAAWQVYTGSCGTSSLTSTTGNSITVTPTATTTYYIRGEGGCAIPGVCSAVTVSVNTNCAGCIASSLTAVTAAQTVVCSGGNSTAISINGSLNSATAWQVYTGSCGTTSLASTTGNSITVTPTVTTTYYIRGEGGCAAPGLCSAVTISVNTNCAGCIPASLTSVSASQTTICQGNSSVININGSLNSATAWKVYTGSCGTASLTNVAANSITVTPNTTTTYFIRGEGGCATPGSCSAVTVSVNNCTGIAQAELNNSFSVYPNPASDLIQVEGPGMESYQVMIYNTVGQLVLTHYNQGSIATIYLSDLASGMYHVKLLTEKGVVIKKIVKN